MKILIIVDMQNDFVTGSLGTKEAKKIIPNIKKKIQEYSSRGDIIIFTRDTHDTDYLQTQEGKVLPVEHCIYPTNGWEIVDELKTPDCTYVNKSSFGWLHWGEFDFKNKEVELVGVCTDICVISNALILKASFPEIKITVDASCCAGVSPEKHKAALDVMKSCQINVIGE